MIRKPLMCALLAACAVPMTLTGCNSAEKQGNHDRWMDEADTRWQDVKSGIALQMAEQQFNTGQLALALKTVEEQLEADPDNAGLWLMAGRVALENSELEISHGRLAKAIELDPELADPHYYQGIIHQRWQQYEQALTSYGLAREKDPKNPGYTLAEAEMLAQLNRVGQAIAVLEVKARYFDQNAGIRAMLGHLHRRNGDHDQAVFWFKQAAMLAPEDHKLTEELARSYMATEQNRQAASTLRLLLYTDYGKNRADLRRMLAEALQHDGQTREARNTYQQLTRDEPTSIEDWFKLGQLNFKLEDYAAALQSANRMINLAPDDHRGYTLAGMVWQKRGSLDRALAMYDRAAQADPDNTTPRILRGMALQHGDRPEAAAQAYRQALDINPDDARAQRLLANVTENIR